MSFIEEVLDTFAVATMFEDVTALEVTRELERLKTKYRPTDLSTQDSGATAPTKVKDWERCE